MKDNEPGEYAKVKQDLKGKVNLNDLEVRLKRLWRIIGKTAYS